MNTRIFTSLFVSIFTAAVVGHQPAAQSTPAPQDQKPKTSNDSRPPRPPFRWWTMEKYRQELKLTADQATQIEKIYQVSMDRLKAQKDDFDRAQTAALCRFTGAGAIQSELRTDQHAGAHS